MYWRRRLLLGTIEFLEQKRRNTKLTLMNAMFLLSKEMTFDFSMYSFYPDKHGPFSSKLSSDLSYLDKKGFINEFEKTIKITVLGSKVKWLLLNYHALKDVDSSFTDHCPCWRVLHDLQKRDFPWFPR
ncbi:MAG: hypothetical protein ACTSWN_11280 [Promethearchaeota archaeon]